MTHPSLTHDRMQTIIAEVAAKRSRQRWRDIGAVLGVLYIALSAGLATVALCDPSQAGKNFGILLVYFFGLTFVLLFPLLCPKFNDLRRRLMFSLIQTAMETGTPPAEILRAHATVYSQPMRDKLDQLANSLENGNSLAVALSQNPDLVRYDVCGIIELGSDEVQTLRMLEELPHDSCSYAPAEANDSFDASYLPTQCFFTIAIVCFLMMWIVPQLSAIFADFEISLPPLTLAIIACCDFFIDYWFCLAPVIAVPLCLSIFITMLQNDKMKSRLPVLRRLFRHIDGARFLRIFGAGLKNQVPIPDSIDTYQRVVNNHYLKKIAQRINEKIRNGGDWIDAFRQAGMVTRGESRLLESAQRTGNLSVVVDQIAIGKELKHGRTGDLMNKLVTIPCLLFNGTLVGLIVIGMFLPIVELIKALA